MGDLIHLDERRSRRAASATAFFFDICCPLSYLVAERVERILGAVDWIPVNGALLCGRDDEDARLGDDDDARLGVLRARVESYARELRLPLVWPDVHPAHPTRPPRAPRARRACTFACELGAGPAFALAASRLAFCGGFDLDDPETLAEAAAAAGVPLQPCLEAAGETWRDEELCDAALLLQEHGVSQLPALRIDGRWLEGEAALLTGPLLRTGRAQR